VVVVAAWVVVGAAVVVVAAWVVGGAAVVVVLVVGAKVLVVALSPHAATNSAPANRAALKMRFMGPRRLRSQEG